METRKVRHVSEHASDQSLIIGVWYLSNSQIIKIRIITSLCALLKYLS